MSAQTRLQRHYLGLNAEACRLTEGQSEATLTVTTAAATVWTGRDEPVRQVSPPYHTLHCRITPS
jgi:hypothetical protein